MAAEEFFTNNRYYHVNGMHCVNCIRKIQFIAKDFPSVKNIKVDLGSKVLTAQTTDDFNATLFQSKIELEGFSIKEINQSDLFGSQVKAKKSLAQIGVAGFCAGNIMLFSAAEYVGAIEETWFKIFPILSGMFFIPILFYSSQSFFQNSYYALKAKKLSIDTPIALAILGGSILSYYKFFLGRNEIYFDSISMFVFLLLFSRYLIFKIQNKYLSPIKVEDVYSEKTVQLYDSSKIINVPIENIKVGDVINVVRNSFVPLDGELLSEEALVSDAFFSGEFLPKEKKYFDLVYAGSRNLSNDFKLKVTKDLSKTRLSEIVEKLNLSLSQKTEITSLADKGSYYLTLAVVLVSFVLIVYYSFYDFQEGLSRVMALLVVACPCGLAIAIPLIQTLALKIGLKKSLLIKKPSVLESLQNVESIFFDKTGTLTSGEIRVTGCVPRGPTSFEKEVIYNLEHSSEHPIAKAIVKWVGLQSKQEMEDFLEKIGTGVSAKIMNSCYEIKSSKDELRSSVQLYKDNVLQFTILLDDTVALGSRNLIEFFNSKKIDSYILSGDQLSFAMKIADILGIKHKNVYAPLSPEEKSDFVKSMGLKSIYLGDGVNDSIAMSHSYVSISMESSANVAFKSSDVHIMSGGLKSIIDLYALSGDYLKAVKYTASLSFLYNIVFSSFAILGYIDPLVAVLLMPISSISITFLAIYMMSKDIFLKDTKDSKIGLVNINNNLEFN